MGKQQAGNNQPLSLDFISYDRAERRLSACSLFKPPHFLPGKACFPVQPASVPAAHGQRPGNGSRPQLALARAQERPRGPGLPSIGTRARQGWFQLSTECDCWALSTSNSPLWRRNGLRPAEASRRPEDKEQQGGSGEAWGN